MGIKWLGNFLQTLEKNPWAFINLALMMVPLLAIWLLLAGHEWQGGTALSAWTGYAIRQGSKHKPKGVA